eukprot:TRINITY_DN359_c0_g1_i2.p1 TRINITY_DN359_c0_g1~~TRINITY_DN359_c0_g1_i2.p1  ORF type:complete len:390 (+),score=84.20 TRINITY_DN359_c0_g1_i2:74-1243(+)
MDERKRKRSAPSSSSNRKDAPVKKKPRVDSNIVKENILTRDSEFICRMKFRNTLPDIPFDPKLLDYPFDPMRFVKYTTTSLENSYQHVLHTEPDLGINVNLIDPEVFASSFAKEDDQQKTKQILEQEDRDLLDSRKKSQQEQKRKERQRPHVSWLMKTKYISPEVSREAKKISKHDFSAYGLSAGKSRERALSKEEMIYAIEEGFKKAAEVPKHPTNPNITAVEVLPLFPDFERWGNTYTEIVFDNNPHPKRDTETVEENKNIINSAIMKGFTEDNEPFVTYFLPDENAEPETTEEGEKAKYKWVRKYKYVPTGEERKVYCFVWLDDCVYYDQISGKTNLSKIVDKNKANPKVFITTRPMNEEEIQEQQNRNRMLEADNYDVDDDAKSD